LPGLFSMQVLVGPPEATLHGFRNCGWTRSRAPQWLTVAHWRLPRLASLLLVSRVLIEPVSPASRWALSSFLRGLRSRLGRQLFDTVNFRQAVNFGLEISGTCSFVGVEGGDSSATDTSPQIFRGKWATTVCVPVSAGQQVDVSSRRRRLQRSRAPT